MKFFRRLLTKFTMGKKQSIFLLLSFAKRQVRSQEENGSQNK